METLSKILIVTNIMCVILILTGLSTKNDWRTISEEYMDTLNICLDTKATVIDSCDKSREDCIDTLTIANEKIDTCNRDWQWAFDNLKDDCKDTIDIYNGIIDDYKEWC